MSLPLLKRTFRSNWKLLLIFALVLALYLVIITGMYDPDTRESMEVLLRALPSELMAAFGFDLTSATLTGFLASYYYGFIALIFPMLYAIITANRLIARHVDRGSMAFLLSSPYTRRAVAGTQAFYLIFSVTLLMGIVTALGMAVCRGMFLGELDVKAFALLNVGALLMHLALSGIAFLASCVFNDTRHSLLLGAGVPIGFYLLKMLSDTGEKLAFLKYFTLFSLFDTKAILVESGAILPEFVTLFVLLILLYTMSILIFTRKDLPL